MSKKEIERALPWWAPAVLPHLETILTKDMVAFEWGSGRSTQWLADRVGALYSVESQQHWYSLVEKYIEGKSNVRLFFVPYKGGGTCPPEEHPGRVQDSKHVAEYVEVMDKVGRQFDFIVIDGLAGQYRVAGLQKALKYLKPGGYLLFDNIQGQPYRRKVYEAGLYNWEYAQFWSPIGSEVGATLTAVFRKPKETNE